MDKFEFIKKFNLKTQVETHECNKEIELYWYGQLDDSDDHILILFHYGYYLMEVKNPPSIVVKFCEDNFYRSETPF